MAFKLVTILCILLCRKNSPIYPFFCEQHNIPPPTFSLNPLSRPPPPRCSRPRVPVVEAIRVTGATCKAAGLYQRLSRHRAREVAAEELAIAEYDRKNDPDNNNMATTALKTPLAVLPSKATMLEAAIDALPEWCDRDTTRKSMTCRARKNLTQAHLSRLTGQVEKRYYDGRYCAGYKAATFGSTICSWGWRKKVWYRTSGNGQSEEDGGEDAEWSCTE